MVISECLSEKQTGETLIRLLLKKQSDLGLHCLSWPFDMQVVFEILEHLPYVLNVIRLCSNRKAKG